MTGRRHWLAAMLVALPGLAGAQTSPLFLGDTADLWLVDAETGQVTGYDTGTWMDSVNPADFAAIDFGDTVALLINQLANSHVPMTPGQPAVSLVGIGDAALAVGAGGAGGHRDLVVSPASGNFAGTIAVRIGVSRTILENAPHQLTWTAVETVSGSTTVDSGVQLAAYAGGTGENGYEYQTFYLVNSGNYSVSVRLQGPTIDETIARTYDLAIPPGEERRDTDGDGIPDVVEADMGLNPFEDDWRADTDGNGWSEFDEWLRRYCLDPVTREPLDAGPECLDADGLPLDSDQDDWSDFDEILRGTNPLDPEPDIPVQDAAPAGNAALKLGAGANYARAPTMVDSVSLCTDGSTFWFDVRFYAEADWTNPTDPSDIIFGIGGDNFAYQAPVQTIRVNFDENGDITRRSPIVRSASTDTEDPPNRWLDGPIDDFTIEEGEPFNWHVYGSVPVGTQPFAPGDTVSSVAIRSGASGNSYTGGYTISGNPADCLDQPVADPGFSEYVAQQRLRYKDFPAASNLYEVEYLVEPGTGVLDVPPLADIQLDQQAAGAPDTEYAGIVVQSYTPTADNIAGVDFRIAPSAEEGVENLYFNIWAGAPRDGELLLSRTLSNVVIDGDPDRPLVVRFEPVAVQPGQPVYFEFRKKAAALVATSADTLAGGGVIEIDGAAADGTTDLVFDVYHDATFANGVGGTRAGFQWWTVGATDLEGTPSYDAITLLRDDEITAAGLAPADIAPRRRMSALANALGSNRLPEMRLPAGKTAVISAVHRHQLPAVQDRGFRKPADYSRIYKNWLPRIDDVSPATMLAENGAGSWTTPAEWRREFIAYLVPRLVQPLGVTLDESSTLAVAVVEAALTEEARLDGAGGILVIDGIYQPGQPIYGYQPGQPVFGDLLSHQNPYVENWEDNLGRLASDAFSLDQSFAAVTAALGSGQPLEPLGQWLRERFYAGVPGTSSDRYMAGQLIAFPDVCKVPTEDIAARQADVDGWNEFLNQCPAWFDDAAFAEEREAARDRCYLVRLNLLPGAGGEIGGDATLLDRAADSDADGALNADEIELPVVDVTLPWQFDSDGDAIADLVDPCPNDPYNDCSANPIRPTVTIGPDFEVYEPAVGADFALVSVHLERLYDVPVTVCYEAVMDLGDSATPGVDYDAVTGCVTIEPGQKSALIPVPVNADAEVDAGETFTVRITSITNGQLGDDGLVVVTINDPAPAENTPPVFTSETVHTALAGITDTGYTATAVDADGDVLTFGTSGGADQAQFAIDPASGVLAFVTAPDFSAPADADGDNVYEVQLTVDDGNAGTDTLDLAVTVVEAGLTIEVTFPLSDSNLGGAATTTVVTGNVVDPLGDPVDPADINFIDVNGELATLDPVVPGRWSVTVPVAAGPNTLTVTLERADTSTDTAVVDIDNFTLHPGFDDIEIDAANGRALVVETITPGLLAVDLATGERTVLSGGGIGTGTALDSPRDVVLDTANNRALVVDWRDDAVVAVDLATGNRTFLSGQGTGAGSTLDGPQSLALDAANNRVLVATTVEPIVYAVDLATGDRTVFSSGGTGSGPAFGSLRHIVLDSGNGRALVSDGNLDAILAVDLATGDRTILSDAATGSGPLLVSPETLALDVANNRLLVAELGGWVTGIDLATGNRMLVTDYRPDFEVNNNRFDGIAVDAGGNRFLLSDSRLDQILTVDLTDATRGVLTENSAGTGGPETLLWSIQGLVHDPDRRQVLLTRSGVTDSVLTIDLDSTARSVLTDRASVGSGPAFDFPQDIVIDADNSRALFVAASSNTLLAVDLASGDRTLVSGGATGTGPAFGNPYDLALDAANDRVLVLDTGLGVFSVALATGDRVIVSDAATGTGPIWNFPRSLAFDPATGTAFVLDYTTDVLYAVDVATGNRSVVSDNVGAGTGPNFDVPHDMAPDFANNRVLVVDYGFGNDAILAVDLATGDRSFVSGAGVGSGVGFLNPYYIALDIANSRAFVYDVAITGVVIVDLDSGQRAIAAKY